ncbi:hypothetical protein QDA00_gp23 [Microbacterium phage Matzah]|uniref:Uncharacterized protein n=1 Tax=Microbacterium phage Matzah TaxID=2686228 RepID=A0A6B9L6P2_9CAUD|nr:hypothetical protein QDA00_gp23 [Microbacterium phage Matzah]QHB37080.1 hypothetical protein SEA_MATZAH_87 [Microbacterium phage Matzah]
MTETRYYSSTASLNELLDSPAIGERSKANIRVELAHRRAACLPIHPPALKALRETLALAQTALGVMELAGHATTIHTERIGQIIEEIDRHRPLGPDGKHDDRHTETCGCEDR